MKIKEYFPNKRKCFQRDRQCTIEKIYIFDKNEIKNYAL